LNLAEIQAALREEHLDGWLFFDHHQRDPLAYRILGLSPNGPVSRRWYYYIPAHGEPKGLVHRIEPEVLRSLPGRHQMYAGWASQLEGLQSLLEGAKRVAMQYSPNCAIPYVSMIDGGTLELVRGLGVEVLSSANLIQFFEARWSSVQLESHLEAGRRVDEILRSAFERIGTSLSSGSPVNEFEIQQFIRAGFEREGLETDHGPIVAVNANASNPHYEPSAQQHQPIRAGDVVLIDLWAKLRQPLAVFYDITWTGYCGLEAPSEVTNVFTVVRDARKAAVQRVKDACTKGELLRGFEVDDAARDYISRAGFAEYFVHRTGHSIGVDVHGAGANMDNLETHDDRRIIPHTCFSIEPGIYLPAFGIRSEVNVYVDETDARVTGAEQQTLVLIPT
jgi:Xaa-Pro aminopeptidase